MTMTMTMTMMMLMYPHQLAHTQIRRSASMEDELIEALSLPLQGPPHMIALMYVRSCRTSMDPSKTMRNARFNNDNSRITNRLANSEEIEIQHQEKKPKIEVEDCADVNTEEVVDHRQRENRISPQSVLDSLVATILSQSTTEGNSRRAFAQLKHRFPTWEEVTFITNICMYVCMSHKYVIFTDVKYVYVCMYIQEILINVLY